MKRVAVAGLLALGLCASAHAEDSFRLSPEALFGGIVQESDVTLVFGYLREALGAAVEGREAPPPEELTQRAEAIGGEMKRRGAAAGRAIIDVIEATVRGAVREPRPPLLPRDPGRRI